MSTRMRSDARRLRSLVLAGAVLASGLVAAGAAVSGAAPRSTVPPLDHQLCYSIKAPRGFVIPPGVVLKNAIQTAVPWQPFRPGFAKLASWHCNPTNKQVQLPTGGFKTYKALNPPAHLMCWGIDYVPANRPVFVTNQFGTKQPLLAVSPTLLCVPSWKKRFAPPNRTPNEPPKLDHFTCYTTPKAAAQWTIPPVVKVEDEFSAPAFSPVAFTQPNKQPNLVCVPTIKIVKTKVYNVQTPGDLGFVCWAIRPTPFWKSWFDQNQFGQGRLVPSLSAVAPELEELCVPSTVTTLVTGR